jgi:single-strand DNA-binding protein
MSFHRTQVIGNLGGKPELRYLPSGTPVANASVAVTERWTDRQTNQKQEKTTWYRASFWNKQAEIAHQYLDKGQEVMLEGNVSATAYTGNDGEPKASLDLRVNNLVFLRGGQQVRSDETDAAPGSTGNNYPPTDTGNPSDDVDDIPF